MKREHWTMNQNSQIARFLSTEMKLWRGIITVTKFGNVSFQLYTTNLSFFHLPYPCLGFVCPGSYLRVRMLIRPWLHAAFERYSVVGPAKSSNRSMYTKHPTSLRVARVFLSLCLQKKKKKVNPPNYGMTELRGKHHLFRVIGSEFAFITAKEVTRRLYS